MRLFCRFSNIVEVVAIILDSLDITMNNFAETCWHQTQKFHGKIGKAFSVSESE